MANLDDVVSITAKPAGSLTAPSCGKSVNVQHVDSLDEPEVFVKDAVTHLGVRDNKVKTRKATRGERQLLLVRQGGWPPHRLCVQLDQVPIALSAAHLGQIPPRLYSWLGSGSWPELSVYVKQGENLNMWHIRHAILALTLAASASVPAVSADPWPTYQGNASHSGYVPVTLDPSSFALRWQKTIGTGSMQLNPVAGAEGKVFVTEAGYFSNQGLYALSADDGALMWNLNYGSVRSVNPPAYSAGTVYIQTVNHSTDTYLRAYSATNGSLVFQSPHAAQWEQYYAPTVFDNTVYVNGGYYGGMYAFDAITGSQRWYATLNQYDQWTPAVSNVHAYAYVGESCSGCANAGLTAIDRLTGSKLFTIYDPGFVWNGWSMNQAPVLGEQNDVLAINGGRLISFDLGAQAIRWQVSGGFTNQPSIAKGAIYAVSAGALSVRDEATGAPLWAWGAPSGSLIGPVIVTDSHVLVRTATTVYAIDLTSRDSVWSYPAGGHLALADGVLYVAGAAGTLTAITAGAAPEADLALVITDSPDPARRNRPLTYVATVANLGPAAATGIVLSIDLPSGMAVSSIPAGCSMTATRVICTYASIAAGDQVNATVVVIPQVRGTTTVTAEVAAKEPDPFLGNNAATQTTRIR